MSYLNREEASTFLEGWGIDLAQLHKFAPKVESDECLALMGSIAEGLANDESDVDILYLGRGELKDKLVMHMDTSYRFGVSHDENGREINVEQLTFDDLNRLGERVSMSLECLADPRKTQGAFVERNEMKLKMLHRIKTAIPLINPHVLEDWKTKLRLDDFHQFVCLSLVQNLMNQREDIVGEVNAGKIESALWITKCQFAPTLVAALLASVGETNAHIKWHYQLIERNRDRLGPELVDRVLRFAFQPIEELRTGLLEKIIAISEPVIADIYKRQRLVRRALMAFSLTVRYTDPKSQERWVRSEGHLAQ